MSFSAGIIEKWLLTGKAIYRSASVGGAGLVRLKVPIGKTFIITKIELCPIFNAFDDSYTFQNPMISYQSMQQNLVLAIERLQFQLVFYNSKNTNHYNIRPKYQVNNYVAASGNSMVDYISPSYIFEKEVINTFYIVEDDSWLYLKFFDFAGNADTRFSVYQDQYQSFLTGSQNWNPTNNFGYNGADKDIATWRLASPNTDYTYTPTGQDNQYIIDNFILPNSSVYTHFLVPYQQIQQFIPIDPFMMYSIPFYNVEYIEINNRLSTTGLDI